MKIEDAMLGTSTGSVAPFVNYFSHWEKRIFQALNLMVLNGMGGIRSLFPVSLKFTKKGKLYFYFKKPILEVLFSPFLINKIK
jgi:hypothetical protein